MAEIFKLMGTVSVDVTEAVKGIDEMLGRVRALEEAQKGLQALAFKPAEAQGLSGHGAAGRTAGDSGAFSVIHRAMAAAREVPAGSGLLGDRGGLLRPAEWLAGVQGGSGSEGWMGAMSQLLAALSTMKGDVSAAVAEGLSGVTITGHVTTGNVVLNSGALVGALTPGINLRLGWENKLSGRG